jgi:hypothetical protein
VIAQNQILWDMCVAFSVDNASVKMGKRNSIKGRYTTGEKSWCVICCLCHMAHNAARKGWDRR